MHYRLDYCNALLARAANSQTKRLSVQNTAALLCEELIIGTNYANMLHSLHWLPVRQRIKFTIFLFAWKCECVHGASLAHV